MDINIKNVNKTWKYRNIFNDNNIGSNVDTTIILYDMLSNTKNGDRVEKK